MEEIKKTLNDYQAFIFFIVIVILTIVTAILLGKYLQRKITEKTKDHQIDVTNFIFLKHMIVVTVYFFGFGWALLSLPITHTFAHSLLAGAGATTLILGLASKQLFNSLISGVFLVINRPFKIDDTIEFQDSKGKVIEINLDATLLQDENGDKIIIPSSLLLTNKIKIISKSTL